MSEAMNKVRVEALLDFFARHYEIPIPQLLWVEAKERGEVHYDSWVIEMGPNVLFGVEACVVHEFAHLLAHSRAPNDREDHGETFFKALLSVVCLWYMDARAYPWKNEHEYVRCRALECGFF